MRSMLSVNRRDFVPPSDCNSVNEVIKMHRLKGLETFATVVSNHNKCLIIGHARAGDLPLVA